jgi:hypothetical protein
MVIANAKYERKHNGVQNLYEADFDSMTRTNLSNFEIPRYEELTYLRLEALEE